MREKRHILWCLLTVLVSVCMLVLVERPFISASAVAEQPFANSVEQRAEMINELRAIRQLLLDQNTLLREQNKLLLEQLNILKKMTSGELRRESDAGKPTK